MSLSQRLLPILFVSLGLAVQASAASISYDYVPEQVIVGFQENSTAGKRQSVLTGIGAEILESDHRVGYTLVQLAKGASVEEAIEYFEQLPSVVWVEPNGYYKALDDCPSCPQDPGLVLPPSTPNQWGIFKTGVHSLWKSGDGGDPSVVIGIVDSGIDNFASPHIDLADNVLNGPEDGRDFVDTTTAADPTDQPGSSGYGHGTHVAGIAAAVANDIGIAGVAYCSKIKIIRVLDCSPGKNCRGTWANISKGIVWAADNGCDIINLSLGDNTPSIVVENAILHAYKAGAIVIAASGNDGFSTKLGYPAQLPHVIAVGATDTSDAVRTSSNAGPELDVVAPGENIWSTYTSPSYASRSGTSMAAPFVSGIAAILRARNPGMWQRECESYLRSHTVDLAGTRDGWGRVDFQLLSDASDAPPPYAVATHKNSLWEWLGSDVTAEVSATDPEDEDGRTNIGGPIRSDGGDDGVFGGSFSPLPLTPPYWGLPNTIRATETVCDHLGPRYGLGGTGVLMLDIYIDWYENLGPSFSESIDWVIAGDIEDPSLWGADTKEKEFTGFEVPDEHIWGNPMWFRSRLVHTSDGYALDALPDGPAGTGEVEDVCVINMVEDFDTFRRMHDPSAPYFGGGGWILVPDEAPCQNRPDTLGMKGDIMYGTHPVAGACDGSNAIGVMSGPEMDWTEYTSATLSFWYCHDVPATCTPMSPDSCRVVIDTGGVKTDIFMIPMGFGVPSLDLSAYTGASYVKIEFWTHTDWPGYLKIDDIVVTAEDKIGVTKIVDLALSRDPGSNRIHADWTHPDENDSIGTPAMDPWARSYSVRYSKDPIVTEADWTAATRVRPYDLTFGTALPVPEDPGAGTGFFFDAPSAIQPYHVAVRTADEVVHYSPLSNSPSVPNLTSLGVSVTSLNDTLALEGDTAVIFFNIENTGNTEDLFALSLLDEKSWGPVASPNPVLLSPGGTTIVSASMYVPPDAAPDSNEVILTATSIADMGLTSASDSGLVIADIATSVRPDIAPIASNLSMIGPNPFFANTVLKLSLRRTQPGSIRVIDAAGRLVRTIASGTIQAGVNQMTWDGMNNKGNRVAPGVYFIKIDTDEVSRSEKVVLLR